jgi:hypothetical protein
MGKFNVSTLIEFGRQKSVFKSCGGAWELV